MGVMKDTVLGGKKYTYHKGAKEKIDSIAEIAWRLLRGLVKRGEK